jgi:hypothetical protein
LGKDANLPTYTVNLSAAQAYEKVKSSFTKKGGTVTAEEAPKQFTVKQGSLWGISPKTAKKTVTVTMHPVGDKTDVDYTSELASDWKNITFIGCVLAFALAGVCVWMASDLEAFLVSGNPTFWSWLVTSGGHVELQAGEAFVNLTWGLAIFLSAVIALELAILVYACQKIETFAQEIVSAVD